MVGKAEHCHVLGRRRVQRKNGGLGRGLPCLGMGGSAGLIRIVSPCRVNTSCHSASDSGVGAAKRAKGVPTLISVQLTCSYSHLLISIY